MLGFFVVGFGAGRLGFFVVFFLITLIIFPGISISVLYFRVFFPSQNSYLLNSVDYFLKKKKIFV